MKLHPERTDERSLIRIGEEASAMLTRQDFFGLANRFGYALAYDREPATAIEADYSRAVASPLEVAPKDKSSVKVKYLKPNNTGLFAVVECVVPVSDGAAVLLELIVAGKDEEMHITLEDISGIAA